MIKLLCRLCMNAFGVACADERKRRIFIPLD